MKTLHRKSRLYIQIAYDIYSEDQATSELLLSSI